LRFTGEVISNGAIVEGSGTLVLQKAAPQFSSKMLGEVNLRIHPPENTSLNIESLHLDTSGTISVESKSSVSIENLLWERGVLSVIESLLLVDYFYVSPKEKVEQSCPSPLNFFFQ